MFLRYGDILLVENRQFSLSPDHFSSNALDRGRSNFWKSFTDPEDVLHEADPVCIVLILGSQGVTDGQTDRQTDSYSVI